jgi:hypothetical protein
MKRFALAILLSAFLASVSFAQQDPSDAPVSREDVEKYLDTMHARDLMKSTLDAVTKQMHQMNP